MPSFDIVSEIDMHEVSNAVDQSNRELQTRFDFKGVDADFSIQDNLVVLRAPSDFQLGQMRDIVQNKMVKRNIDLKSLVFKDPELNLSEARQSVELVQGMKQEHAKPIVKFIKSQKIKVQPAIQGEEIRVSGKKRDDLQQIMQLLREEDFGLPLQFKNFRD